MAHRGLHPRQAARSGQRTALGPADIPRWDAPSPPAPRWSGRRPARVRARQRPIPLPAESVRAIASAAPSRFQIRLDFLRDCRLRVDAKLVVRRREAQQRPIICPAIHFRVRVARRTASERLACGRSISTQCSHRFRVRFKLTSGHVAAPCQTSRSATNGNCRSR
jgi:hypothetical protein